MSGASQGQRQGFTGGQAKVVKVLPLYSILLLYFSPVPNGCVNSARSRTSNPPGGVASSSASRVLS